MTRTWGESSGQWSQKSTGIIIETPTEARQAERGTVDPALLTVSLIAVVSGMASVWYIFFRT